MGIHFDYVASVHNNVLFKSRMRLKVLVFHFHFIIYLVACAFILFTAGLTCVHEISRVYHFVIQSSSFCNVVYLVLLEVGVSLIGPGLQLFWYTWNSYNASIIALLQPVKASCSFRECYQR